ncbi:MAG: hypothetical protein A3B37_02395 [Candidatus Sungbacteria bacterium RIFCSPLOWO2_01_FULL_59_16]|uniref:Uncharacterized protein n=1 Tax=Candidatus Sungbacteria bacterium RIFCSPLOWO2_01_FULL_59_16 TaxID=1802280 RepID=A0A1G2LF03_9BACT|nr:MAG: hypothetical protein A3B37_02395 [Candidatus Sungbacteria bacterium RIFCSPLOWO2_01_FULL_59_16]
MATFLYWVAVVDVCSIILLAGPLIAAYRRPICPQCEHNCFMRRIGARGWACTNHGANHGLVAVHAR